MSCRSSFCGVVAALAFATALPAQITSLPPIAITSLFPFQQSFTTGMVGFTANQTARLNVLNLNAVPSSSATQPANCTVELQFLDDKGTLVKENVVPNFAPGTATSFDLPRASVTSATTARAQIRGVVTINPAPTPVGSPAPVGYCSVMTTLEIFDSTGSTISFTSDARYAGLPNVIPLNGIGIK